MSRSYSSPWSFEPVSTNNNLNRSCKSWPPPFSHATQPSAKHTCSICQKITVYIEDRSPRVTPGRGHVSWQYMHRLYTLCSWVQWWRSKLVSAQCGRLYVWLTCDKKIVYPQHALPYMDQKGLVGAMSDDRLLVRTVLCQVLSCRVSYWKIS